MNSGDPDWYAPASDSPLDLNVEQQGNEWVNRLSQAFGGIHARRTPGSPVLAELSTSSMTARLWLRSDREGRIHAFVVGEGAPAEDQIRSWKAAVDRAGAALRAGHEAYDWRAVLGPSPYVATAQEAAVCLAGPTTVGPLKLAPGGGMRVDYADAHLPSFGTHSVLESWPLFVEGESRGYNWWSASAPAAHDLHRLAGLLSLVTGAHWDVRHSPMQRQYALSAIPKTDPGFAAACESSLVPRILKLPEWMHEAWTALDRRSDLADSLAAHHEGLALFQRHPSFALVAFVGSIERLGVASAESTRCPECKTITGATESFRTALRRVMSKDHAQSLTKNVYGRRSETAHAGRLHGLEAYVGGVVSMGIFGTHPGEEFVWSALRELKIASARVVTDALIRDVEEARATATTGPSRA